MPSVVTTVLHDLARIIRDEQGSILAWWRTRVRELPSARHLNTPTLNDHIPDFLADLALALEAGANADAESASVASEARPPAHGLQRLKDGYDIEEVVAEYGMLRNAVHVCAERHGLQLQGKPVHILNRIVDDAVGRAVGAYALQQAAEVRQRREEHLAFVAHDLRTPLHAISLCVRLVEHSLDLGESPSAETSRRFKAISRNVRHLQELISNVAAETSNLETDQGVRLERRRFELWPLTEELAENLRATAAARAVRLVNAVPDDLTVYADAGALRRILQNLVANAIAYTSSGEVTVFAVRHEETGAVACEVRDTGAGIAPQRLQLVFEKHESDSTVDGASGLGLAIVRTMVEAHGGEVSVESVMGVGSTFRFTLPADA